MMLDNFIKRLLLTGGLFIIGIFVIFFSICSFISGKLYYIDKYNEFKNNSMILYNYFYTGSVISSEYLYGYLSKGYQLAIVHNTYDEDKTVIFSETEDDERIDTQTVERANSLVQNKIISKTTDNKIVTEGLKYNKKSYWISAWYIDGEKYLVFYSLSDFYTGVSIIIAVIFCIFIFMSIIMCIIMDSQIKKAAIPVQNMVQAQDDFISFAAHELRTPLQVISSGVTSMKDSMDDAEAYSNFYRLTLSECKRASKLIEALLFFARNTAPFCECAAEELFPDEIIMACYEKYSEIARLKGVELIIDISEDDNSKVCLNRDMTIQTISVLLDNAFSYTDNGYVSLAYKFRDGKIIFIVADTGKGIPDGIKDRIFNKFCSDKNADDAEGHLGLGLSIAEKLLAASGGEICVRDNEGGGTVFEVGYVQQK